MSEKTSSDTPEAPSQSAVDAAQQAEVYAHGYDSALTLKMHASRTADRQAAWFLPHLRAGMSLLDCGCGSGSITVGLAVAVDPGRVIGVDVSEVEIERARARAAETGIANLEFAVGDIYRLDSADDAFDAIFSHNVLEHLQEPVEALRECAGLKPGGVIGIRDGWGGVLSGPRSGAGIVARYIRRLAPAQEILASDAACGIYWVRRVSLRRKPPRRTKSTPIASVWRSSARSQ
jgi:SAM-dependent methyltransferase